MTIEQLITDSERAQAEHFKALDEIALFNQQKVLNAFQEHRVAYMHFNGSTGYGYGDIGRETLGKVFASAFGGEAGIVSPAMLSGTHTLTVALFGVLRANDTVLCVSGQPYDTLQGVIYGEGNGSLKDYQIGFDVVDLTAEGKFDYPAVQQALNNKNYAMLYIQRSRGYELRDAFSIKEIEEMCRFARENGFQGCIFTDNCYGEFVEKQEPTEVGCDVIAGSLIKNPGGGLAPTGGYVVGKQKYIDLIANRLTAPSVGSEIGSYAFGYQYFYQGFFLAPHVVNQALKGSLLIGQCMHALGYENSPKTDILPTDITRAISFDSEKQLCDFIQAVQAASPVDGFVIPEPWDMPGYEDKVIMAAGTFVGGATSELSADAPIRKPYTAYFQGGLTYEHCKCALMKILEKWM
ncbi:MAG: methionine gamma-lyase family protein [Clostridia bacterium]|nr:methionine gamma-lyase family protein [Clostridia bacterium]MBR7100443.1 methionine gamma-lyase family protein [Clostridia bacterium]